MSSSDPQTTRVVGDRAAPAPAGYKRPNQTTELPPCGDDLCAPGCAVCREGGPLDQPQTTSITDERHICDYPVCSVRGAGHPLACKCRSWIKPPTEIPTTKARDEEARLRREYVAGMPSRLRHVATGGRLADRFYTNAAHELERLLKIKDAADSVVTAFDMGRDMGDAMASLRKTIHGN